MGLLIIPILAFLIIIHELGHFFAARSVGVTVEEFGIGIPPRVRGWKWKGVLWSLNAIPFGGFVRVKGEDGTDMSEGSMNATGPLKRAWFLVAGPLMNLLAAVVLSILIVGVQGTPTETSPLYIGSVAQNSPAESAGWLPGDKIIAVDNTQIESADQLITAINDHAGAETSVTIARGTEQITTEVTPRDNPPANQGATGISFGDSRLSDVMVRNIEDGSPAATAGLRDGDVIKSIDGTPVEAFAQAVGIMNANIGNDVTLSVKRDGQLHDISLTIPNSSILITNVNNGSAASDAMLYSGDRITAVDDIPITSASAFEQTLAGASGKDVELSYLREGTEGTTKLNVPAFDDSTQDNPVAALGMAAAPLSGFRSVGVEPIGSIIYDDVPLSRVVQKGWDQFWTIITGTVEMIRDMFTEGVSRDQFTGPIGMGQLTSELLSDTPDPAWVVLTQLTILISISLGVLNLLPLPALDGGRLLFVLIEILRGGKRIAPEKEGLVHLAGMVLLLGLMFFIAFGDISRIMDGQSILP